MGRDHRNLGIDSRVFVSSGVRSSGSCYSFWKRDNALEIEIQGTLASDLKVEPDLAHWFPIWGAPGL